MYFDENGNGTRPRGSSSAPARTPAARSRARTTCFTAGHCLPPAELSIPASAVLVSFDGDAGNGVSSPLTVSSYHQMPGFGRDLGDIRDLGILLLPAGSVPAGTPAVQLPTAGYLDQLKASGQLNFRIVDLVGYGVVPVWDEKGPTQFAFDGVRRSGTSIITGLHKAMVHYNQQRHGIGTGSGLCFGDSARRSSTVARCSSSRSRAAATANAMPTTRTTGSTRRRRGRSSASS